MHMLNMMSNDMHDHGDSVHVMHGSQQLMCASLRGPFISVAKAASSPALPRCASGRECNVIRQQFDQQHFRLKQLRVGDTAAAL